jgi:hypothetical protein
MGTILASAIMSDAAAVLHDEGFDRWDEATLFTGLNRGQREAAFFKPDVNAVRETVTLVAGTVQSIPTDAFAFGKILRNMGTGGDTPGLAPRMVSEDRMNDYHPYWHSEDADTEVDFYMFDDRDPGRFMVSPPQPASGFGQIDAIFYKAPADMVKPDGDYDVVINIDNIYSNVLLYYDLFWAFNKDADFSPSSAARAVAYYNLFLTALGRKDMVEGESAPEPEKKYKND